MRNLGYVAAVLLVIVGLVIAWPAPTIADQVTAIGSVRAYLPWVAGAAPAPTPTGTLAPTPGPGTPTPTTTPPVVPPPDEAAERLSVPAGFAIRIYASNLSNPRLMAFGPDGQLYVAERGADRIIRLPDANRDGRAEQPVVVAQGLNNPHNVEWYQGSLYVAEEDKIIRLTDGNTDGDFGDVGEKQTITTNIPVGGGHSSRTVHIGPDGKLYVSAGSSGNNNVETDKRRATIMRFNLDGSIPADNPFANDPDPTRRPVWAEGLRNSVDFLWTPGGQLWANHNGSDGLGDNVPPEEIVINVERGKHYGWPYCYTPTEGRTPAGTSEVRDERVPLPANWTCAANATPAVFTDKAHVAPLGMALGAGTNLPAQLRNDLFVAYHGSWNTNDPANYRDCEVRRIVIENGQPVRSEQFVNGFRNPGQKCGEAWGRPADVVFGLDGVMYISDDHSGRVYRVVYTGR
jgi:glucose/arabinose dehydrogenase